MSRKMDRRSVLRSIVNAGLATAATTIFSGEAVAADPVADRITQIVVEHLGVDKKKVVASARFVDDLGVDSLDTVELAMAFEEEFGVEIPDDLAETTLTVGDAVKVIKKLTRQK